MNQPKNIDEAKQIIKDVGFEPESKSYNRTMLLKGLDSIKCRIKYNNALKVAGNYSIKTEDLDGGWISHFVRDTVNGKIDTIDQTIIWCTDDKKIKFNPFTGTVEYVK